MKNSFKELKLDELVAKRADLRKKYFDLRFKKIVEHLENPLQLRVMRRQIARLETRIGLAGAAPAAAASPKDAEPKAGAKSKAAVKAKADAKVKPVAAKK